MKLIPVKQKLINFIALMLFTATQVLAQTREEQAAAEAAERLRVVGLVALGVVVTVLLIAVVWLLVVKKEKDGKIKVKTYSAKDTYTPNQGGDGFAGGF